MHTSIGLFLMVISLLSGGLHLAPARASDLVALPGAEPFNASLTKKLRSAAKKRTSPPRTTHFSADGSPKFINRLIFEASPYLEQHAYNPVNWRPWGNEAFEIAKKSGKPVFLSIGYSTCHWCHVMEKESFESEEIAALLNENFVCIKVDREERPDIDSVYIDAVRRLTGSAGWPLSVFLTPERKPFFGGTYFPPTDRYGRKGMKSLVPAIAKTWQGDREGTVRTSEELSQALSQGKVARNTADLTTDTLTTAFEQLSRSFDPVHGGFGRAPKFPQAHIMQFLIRYWQRSGVEKAKTMASTTLDHMARGGIYDQLGGGFHRYSVDGEWIVPHFEKMLYDQAINSRAFLEAFHAGSSPGYASVARGVFDYVLNDLSAPSGGFYSAEDADSEGEEGLFYLWLRDEITGIVGGEDASVIADFFGVSPGTKIPRGELPGGRLPLRLPDDVSSFFGERKLDPTRFGKSLEVARGHLLKERNKRPRPLRDEKIITAWNGLMISSLAYGSVVLDEPRYLRAAEKAANFVLAEFHTSKRLKRSYRGESRSSDGFLDDYSFLLLGLVDLYEASLESKWLFSAHELAEKLIEYFADPASGGFRYSSEQHEKLIATADNFYDGAIPSAHSVAALALLRLGRLTMSSTFEARARAILSATSVGLKRAPSSRTQMLMALDFVLGPSKEIVIAGPRDAELTQTLLGVVRSQYLPRSVTLLNDPSDSRLRELVPFLAKQKMRGDKPTAYVCENYVCSLPTSDPTKLRAQLAEDPRAGKSH